jgi:hypothetical protein
MWSSSGHIATTKQLYSKVTNQMTGYTISWKFSKKRRSTIGYHWYTIHYRNMVTWSTYKSTWKVRINCPRNRKLQCIKISRNTSFPYLDIQLSWSDASKLSFNVYKKPGKSIKYLNTNSHHHTNLKTAVLQGVELRLALLTTVSDEKEKLLSLSDIYLDKHEALCKTLIGERCLVC